VYGIAYVCVNSDRVRPPREHLAGFIAILMYLLPWTVRVKVVGHMKANVFAGFGSLAVLACCCSISHAAPPDARATIAEWQKVVAPNGVEELIEIPVADTRQWISVRGRDRTNPILLMIHGGPASPELPTSWAFQNGWEDFFTVVQWDQRGSGKTFLANEQAKVAPTLSLDRITEDAAAVVQYLRTKYGKEKIFVLGHSWGSLVGINLAQRHPEMLYAYIGMGQIINGHENEVAGYAQTLRLAEEKGNAQAVAELKGIAPYPEADGSAPLPKLDTLRKWSVSFGGLSYGRSGLDYYLNLANLSPAYSAADVAAIDQGSAFSLGRLWPEVMKSNFSKTLQWRCPIVLFEGRHDLTTPSSVAAEWFARIKAPEKKLVWFENSAHMMMVEEPGQVLLHLVQDVRPLAKR
jgi:proline iminopeptidase